MESFVVVEADEVEGPVFETLEGGEAASVDELVLKVAIQASALALS